jgi:hypothetical protein
MDFSFAPVTKRHRGGSVGPARPAGESMPSQAMRSARRGLVPALPATQIALADRPRRAFAAVAHSPFAVAAGAGVS